MNKLLVNADDFGHHESVNNAILNCVLASSVNSVSVMANGKAPDYDLLRTISKRNVFTGIHITWVGEKWISQDMLIPDRPTLIRKIVFGGRRFLNELKNEAEAQIVLFLQHGISADHIDSHQHLHHLPLLWEILYELKNKYQIARIRVAYTGDRKLVREGPEGHVLQILSSMKFDKIKHHICAGIKYTGNYNLLLLKQELEKCSGLNTELIVHPGCNNMELNRLYYAWNFDWETEHAALMDETFLEMVVENGFFLERKYF